MKRISPQWPNGASKFSGFTLVETLIVMVVLGIASVAIISLQGNIFKGQAENKDSVVATQLVQECAEQVLAMRRCSCPSSNPTCTYCGYSKISSTNFGNNTCGGLTAFNGYSIPSVSITDPYTGSECPGTCKLVSITQDKFSTALKLLIVSY